MDLQDFINLSDTDQQNNQNILFQTIHLLRSTESIRQHHHDSLRESNDIVECNRQTKFAATK